jgi:hypothetical protein
VNLCGPPPRPLGHRPVAVVVVSNLCCLMIDTRILDSEIENADECFVVSYNVGTMIVFETSNSNLQEPTMAGQAGRRLKSRNAFEAEFVLPMIDVFASIPYRRVQ